MKVNVFDILDKGKTLAFKGDEPFIREIIARLTADDPDPARAAKNAHLTAKVVLTREGKTVFLEGEAAAAFSAPCARCLKPVETHLAPSFFVTLFPDKDDSGGEEVQLKNDELDENTYIGEEVDVGLVLNEQILLERPYLILCSEDCKGLCGSCGANRNEQPKADVGRGWGSGGEAPGNQVCDCTAVPASLAFQALKDVKIDLKKE